MNYYGATEIRKDGKGSGLYHYTCNNKRAGIRAVGYCASDCSGHDTEEGAQEHYKQYELDHHLELMRKTNTLQPCAECDKVTRLAARVGSGIGVTIFLCGEHNTRKFVEKHHSVGESISSC